MPLLRTLPLLLALAACTGAPSTPEPPSTTPDKPTADAQDGPGEAPVSSQELMAGDQAFEVLAPSPLALEKQAREAGLGSTLAQVTPSELPPMPPTDDKDAVAFRTGVVFTMVLLSGRESSKEAFLAGVRGLRDGMAALGTGQAWLDEMDEAITFIENDAASRQDLLNELDKMIESSVPDQGWGPGDTTGPLVQAGAWLTGIHLTAKAIVTAEQEPAADALLRRPEVADFFLKYLKTEQGAEKSSVFRNKVIEGLTELKALASKEHLTLADTQRIQTVSGELIELLRPATE